MICDVSSGVVTAKRRPSEDGNQHHFAINFAIWGPKTNVHSLRQLATLWQLNFISQLQILLLATEITTEYSYLHNVFSAPEI